MSDELTARILAEDEAGVVVLLTALPEPQRRKLAKEASRAVKECNSGDWVTESTEKSSFSHWKSPYTEAQRKCSLLAAVATCSAGELRVFAKDHWLPLETVDLWRGLRPPPSFLDEAAEIIIDASMRNWGLARALVRARLSKRPTGDNYTLGLLSESFNQFSRTEPVTLEARVLADPEMLKEEIWRLFEVEGGGETSLATYDKYRGQWGVTFVALMKGGHLSRDRLLDASLDALERDFAAFRAGWFSRFHEMLEPTVNERRARVDVYARLLASPIPPTASFALRAIRAVDAAAPLPAAALLPYVHRVLVGAHKGPAKDALALLSAMAHREREPMTRLAIGKAAALALSHVASDVQRAALELLDVVEPAMDDELRASVSERAAHVAASLRKRAAKWGDTTRGRGAAHAPAPSPPRRETPRVAVAPIASLDELIDACARVLEEDGDSMLVELTLDGISRLCADRPADFGLRTGPLTKRARTMVVRENNALDAHEGHPLAGNIARTILAWTQEEAPPPLTSRYPGADRTLDHFFAARAHEIALRAARGEARALLSLPTHHPAWVDGEALVSRVRAMPRAADLERLDTVLALLRVPPTEQEAVLHDADRLRPFVRGNDTTDFDFSIFSGTYPLGLAYQRLVISGEHDPKPPADDPPAILRSAPDLAYLGPAGVNKHMVRWASTVWPGRMEAYFAEGARQLGNNLDWHTAYWSNAAYLEPLREAGTTMGSMATLLLVLGLAAKEPGESALAVDCAIAALEDGRVRGRTLGQTMARLHPTGFIKAKRWARTLAVVAQASPLSAMETRVAIQATLRGDPAKGPRDEGALVDLLAELCAEVEDKIDDLEAWAYLQKSKHARRVVKVAP